MINPEFQRNFWLELTPHRLIAVPLVCALIIFLVLALNEWTLNNVVGIGALWCFAIFTGIFGTKKASAAIHDEIIGNTWDWQRMSGLNPWAMTWGKLFGKTLVYWYVGAIALVLALISYGLDTTDSSWWRWYLLTLLGVLFSQALGFFFNLIYIRRRSHDTPGRMGGSLYLLVLLGIITFFLFLSDYEDHQLTWFGWRFNTFDFAILSLLGFWLWTLVGAYRIMRRELNHSAHPWVWLGFMVFFGLYVAGLAKADKADALLTFFLSCHTLSLLALFLENKDPVILRALLASLGKADLGKALQLMPAWFSGLLLTSLSLVVLLLLPQRFPDFDWVLQGLYPDFTIATFCLLAWLFLIRDSALLLGLSLSGEARRAEATALVYLLLLYLVIPALLSNLNWDQAIPFFLPQFNLPQEKSLTGALTGAILALGLLLYQWSRSKRRLVSVK